MDEAAYVELMVRLKKVFHDTRKQENIDFIQAMAKKAGMDDVEYVMTASQRLNERNGDENALPPPPKN